MKIFLGAIGILLSTGGIIVGQISENTWIQYGAMGILAFIVFFMTRWIPKEMGDHRKEREKDSLARERLEEANRILVKEIVDNHRSERRDRDRAQQESRKEQSKVLEKLDSTLIGLQKHCVEHIARSTVEIEEGGG